MLLKKEHQFDCWIYEKPFEYYNKSFKFFRRLQTNSDLFRNYYDITSIRISPISTDKKNEHDNIQIIANNISAYIDIEKDIDLKNDKKLGMLGVLLSKYKTFRFHNIGLIDGIYDNYKVIIFDNKPEYISF